MGEQIAVDEEEMVLPGFRFHPTDEELVGFYLRRKIEKRKPLSMDIIIKQIDIYKYDPWDLPKLSNFGEKEWYFFSMRGRKYRNSVRPNRVTCSGFWKATGIDRPVFSGNGNCIGLKKSLVYYRGSAGKGTKTDWMMHEFRLPSCSSIKTSCNNMIPPIINESESWTICKIFMRNLSFKKYTEQTNRKEADSSLKKSIFEPDAGEIQRYMEGECSLQREETFLNKIMEEEEEDGKVCAGEEWNSDVLTNRMNLQSSFGNLNEDEIFSQGDWDDIVRMVDCMMEPAST